jgi:hypothetical protein
MGRAVVTKGHSKRKLGRTIRRLEASVELSPKEAQAKKAEQTYKQKIQATQDQSPVANLRVLANQKKEEPKN